MFITYKSNTGVPQCMSSGLLHRNTLQVSLYKGMICERNKNITAVEASSHVLPEII